MGINSGANVHVVTRVDVAAEIEEARREWYPRMQGSLGCSEVQFVYGELAKIHGHPLPGEIRAQALEAWPSLAELLGPPAGEAPAKSEEDMTEAELLYLQEAERAEYEGHPFPDA